MRKLVFGIFYKKCIWNNLHQSSSNEDVWVTKKRTFLPKRGWYNSMIQYVPLKVKLVLEFNHKNCIWDISKGPIRGRFCQWEGDTTVLREWPIRGRFCQWEGDITVLREWSRLILCWNLFLELKGCCYPLICKISSVWNSSANCEYLSYLKIIKMSRRGKILCDLAKKKKNGSSESLERRIKKKKEKEGCKQQWYWTSQDNEY